MFSTLAMKLLSRLLVVAVVICVAAWCFVELNSGSRVSKLASEKSPHIKPQESPRGSIDAAARSNRLNRVASNDRSWDKIDNPKYDGWRSEELGQLADKRLKELVKVLSDRNASEQTLEALVADDFTIRFQSPRDLNSVYQDGATTVSRLVDSSQPPTQHSGPQGFATALNLLLQPLGDSGDLRCKFKQFRISMESQSEFSTHCFFSLAGSGNSRQVELRAQWKLGWKLMLDETLPRITSIESTECEMTTYSGSDDKMFSDVTATVLADTPSFSTQQLRGFHYWGANYQERTQFSIVGTPGLAVGDVNADGLEDLFVCGEFGLPNRLYVQQPDGTVQEKSDSGVDWVNGCRSALLVDLDNDGDQDLVVGITGGVAFAANDGSGIFTVRSVVACADEVMSLSAVDLDEDGLLDVYVCCYSPDGDGIAVSGIPDEGGEFVLHDANNGAPNLFLHNDGKLTFSDRTNEVGLDDKNQRFSFASVWDDFDNDGDLDLYVANDYGRDNYYRNEGGVFTDVSDQAGAEDAAGGMSVTAGDYNRDGWQDILVSNMFSAAGNRVTTQDGFQPDASNEERTRFSRLARGNTLLMNTGKSPGTNRKQAFSHVSAQAGVEMGRWAWGSRFTDLNNDGWEDIVIANGYITTPDTGDL